MILNYIIRKKFSFNIIHAFKNFKEAVKAPIKHFKSMTQPAGINYSQQTNLTSDAFDEVAQQWQAFYGHNPYDMQTLNYLENAQLANFGTVDNPLVIFTADAPFRYVGCSGPTNEDDYETHQLLWFMIRQGPLQRCSVCGQVFKLVRLRNQYSEQMDYYISNFNQLHLQDLGQHDTMNIISPLKINTHWQHTLFQQQQNTVMSLISPDDHDRVLVDPAYRIQRQTEGEMKAQVYVQAMDQYQNQKLALSQFRQPLSKVDYENLIQSEFLIKKMDRLFRKRTKFDSRKYLDIDNHVRRQQRMQSRIKQRWDSSYTIYSGQLTQQEQRYRDYFETDLQQHPENEELQQFIDKQQLIGDPKYDLSKFDFQQQYTQSPQDDQTSYLQKLIFKFKYRKALDSPQEYDRRNQRMVERQKNRFEAQNMEQISKKYIHSPQANQKNYLKFITQESVLQYNDYFETDQDELQTKILEQNEQIIGTLHENWQIKKEEYSSFEIYPRQNFDQRLGLWGNSLKFLSQVRKVDQKLGIIQGRQSFPLISQYQKQLSQLQQNLQGLTESKDSEELIKK